MLTFITGFFGMNVGSLVDHVDTQIALGPLGFVVPADTARRRRAVVACPRAPLRHGDERRSSSQGVRAEALDGDEQR